jgi:hypothetical protein
MSNSLEKPTDFLKFWSSARKVPGGEEADHDQPARFQVATSELEESPPRSKPVNLIKIRFGRRRKKARLF